MLWADKGASKLEIEGPRRRRQTDRPTVQRLSRSSPPLYSGVKAQATFHGIEPRITAMYMYITIVYVIRQIIVGDRSLTLNCKGSGKMEDLP
jgi:hypothetical protein